MEEGDKSYPATEQHFPRQDNVYSKLYPNSLLSQNYASFMQTSLKLGSCK